MPWPTVLRPQSQLGPLSSWRAAEWRLTPRTPGRQLCTPFSGIAPLTKPSLCSGHVGQGAPG